MIKKLIILSLIIGSSTAINAHCGDCGIGDKKEAPSKTHSHIEKEITETKKITFKDLDLSEKQTKKHKEITTSYEEKFEKLKDSYNNEVLGILTKDQKETFEKNGKIRCLMCIKSHISKK